MATKDIPDKLVVQACKWFHNDVGNPFTVDEFLHRMTGQPMKVVYSAMERSERKGYIEYGVSLRTAWPTDKGKSLLTEQELIC